MECKPIAVLISDVHYSLPTLELADRAMNMAIDKANRLSVPLIVCGDLHDTKANMRAECVNAMIKTINRNECIKYILVGNHDKINEKSEDHALNFLDEESTILLSDPENLSDDFQLWQPGIYAIPYQHDVIKLKKTLSSVPIKDIIIMHQGLQGSNSGDYFMDKTALSPNDVAGRRIISGHYHTRQDIKLPDGGLWSYVGNPYTLNFGEAKDPEKGFQILYSDGSLEFVPTKLRKHVLLEMDYNMIENQDLNMFTEDNKDDILQVRIKGNKEQLSLVTKEKIKRFIPNIEEGYKLDLIYEEANKQVNRPEGSHELLDSVIDSKDLSDTMKVTLKDLWRRLESN